MTSATNSSLTVPAVFDSLPRCTLFVREFASAAGFRDNRLREIELVVEEVVANICRYGYGERSGTLQIHCEQRDPKQLDLLFVDQGHPFNFLIQPIPELTVDLDQREVGGLGVPLVRGLVEQASYQRDGDRNLLRLTIESTRGAAAAPSQG